VRKVKKSYYNNCGGFLFSCGGLICGNWKLQLFVMYPIN
jgi:hypothetical protein